MDILGDIVEHETSVPKPPSVPSSSSKGFPQATAKRPSRWRQRLQEKGLSSMSGEVSGGDQDDGKFYTVDNDTNLKKFKDDGERRLDYSGLSEEERVHQENIEILARMSNKDREEAKQELLDNLDPKVLEMLMKRSIRKYGKPGEKGLCEEDQQTKEASMFDPVEGAAGTWVGGEHELDKTIPTATVENTASSHCSPAGSCSDNLKSSLMRSKTMASSSPVGNSASSEKKIRFSKEAKVIYLDQSKQVKLETPEDDEWEDVSDVKSPSLTPLVDDDAAPPLEDAIQLAEQSVHDVVRTKSGIHFPKPRQPYEELDINDPNFNDKLYEKYFPDLPKNPKQLEWMENSNTRIPDEIAYDSLESVRFDFKGEIITSDNIDRYLGENQGLYNHSKNPELPGYTLTELAHYLRSTYPGQVCIACRTLGRIMYKLGTLEYQVNEVGPTAEDNGNGIAKESGKEGQFEIECWKLIDTLQIIPLLQSYSSDKQKNLSIKNYAIDALWLWKKGGGDGKMKKFITQSQ